MIANSATVQARFNRHAQSYDDVTPVQAALGTNLLRLAVERLSSPPARVLDLGCGTGRLTAEAAARWPNSVIEAVDCAPQMTVRAAERCPRAHISTEDALHYLSRNRDGSADLLLANAVFQWLPDRPRLFGQLRRVLSERGLLAFSTFGPETFCELRNVLSTIVPDRELLHLPSVEVWQQHLADAGFHATFWALKEAQTYPSAGAFLRTLQRSGASYAEGHKPFTRRNLEDIVAAYNSSYASACGGVYATYSTISCLAEPALQ